MGLNGPMFEPLISSPKNAPSGSLSLRSSSVGVTESIHSTLERSPGKARFSSESMQSQAHSSAMSSQSWYLRL